MALALKDRVKETTIVVGTGTATLLGSSIGFQPFSVVGNGNTTYYCISDQFGSNWEVGIGTYSTSGNTLARTTVLASSNGGALVVFTAGIKDVFVTYPAEKGVWLDASGNAIGLGTPAAFVGTNITGTASGLTAGNVTTNANLSGAVTSSGNATSLGSFTSAQLALAISDETGTGKAVFATNPTLTSPTYAGTLTGSTDILNIGSGQVYKDASGNVGIGTSPSWKFQVKGTTSSFLINPDQAADGQIPASVRMASTLGKLSITADIQGTAGNGVTMAYFNGSSWASALEFGNVASGYSDILIGKSGGNVGIGTSSPAAKLDLGTGSGRKLNVYNDTSNAISGFGVDLSGSSYELSCFAGGSGTNLGVFTWLGYNRTTNTYAERMRIDASGNLLVGATGFPSSSSKMLVSGDLNATYANGVIQGQSKTAGDVSYPALYLSKFDNNSTTSQVLVRFAIGNYVAGQGQINGNGVNAAAFGTFSDSRLKENIIDLPSQLDNILALRPVEYDYIESEGGGHQIGFIAQEVQEIYPDLVGEREDGMFTLSDMNKNDARLIKAIQELKAIIDTQQEQINSLLGK